MRLYKFYIFLFYLLFTTTSYSLDARSKIKTPPSIYNTWKFKKIIYEDNSTRVLEKGHFVIIKDSYILEDLKDFGKRRHSYVKNGRVLNVTSGDNIVPWEIIKNTGEELRIKTPIGIYVLTLN